ncbi:MAG: DUF4143 domain-containing protein, partial [Pseudomonadota bacterium]
IDIFQEPFFRSLNLKIFNYKMVVALLLFYLGKKIIYQHLDRDSRSIEVKKVIEILILAGPIIPCYHSESSGIPLKASIDHSIFKVYFLDVGLMNYLHELSWMELESIFEKGFLTKGLIAEQFIAQHLAFLGEGKKPPELLYWLRDKSIQKAEVDFVLGLHQKIIPVEVKAEKGGRLKSLQIFSNEKNSFEAIKFSKEWFYQEQIGRDDGSKLLVNNRPLYSVEAV